MKSYFPFVNFVLIALIVFGSAITCASEHVKKSVEDNRDDNGETNDETVKDESLDIPADPEPNNVTCTRRQNSRMHEIQLAHHMQFPFMVSIMSHQNEHLCSGVIVSNGLILTTATCLTQPFSYVLLNATSARKNDTTVSLPIIKSEKFPTSTDTDKDIGLIYTEKHNNSIAAKIKLSNFTATRNIMDMEVMGFGLNSEVGAVKDLQYVGLENRIDEGRFPEFKDTLHGYIDCVESKVLTCFKDTGGASIFDNELVGIVTKGTDKCEKELNSLYASNKKLVDVIPTYTFKSWLIEKIATNEDQEIPALASFPNKPLAPKRRVMDSVTGKPQLRVDALSGQDIKRFTVPVPAVIFFSCIYLI